MIAVQLTASITGCSSREDRGLSPVGPTPLPINPTAPQPSTSLTVTTHTAGGVADANGYKVEVRDESGRIVSAVVGASTSVTIEHLSAGPNDVMVSDIAPNCAVVGSAEQQVALNAGQNSTMSFDFSCVALPGGSSRVAFQLYDPDRFGYTYKIAVLNSDGSVIVLSSGGTSTDMQPAWSPDGGRIAFASDRDGALAIYTMNADGSSVQRLTNAPLANSTSPSWSPDGSKIVFVSNRAGTSDIYVMDADGSNIVQLTSDSYEDSEPRFSADGMRIAFVRGVNSNQPDPRDWYRQIFIMNADGTGIGALTGPSEIDHHPAFFKNGTRLLYDSNQLGGGGVAVATTIFELGLDATPGGGRLLNTGSYNYLPIPSPDQTRILFTKSDGIHSDLYIMNADGSAPELLYRRTGPNESDIGYSYR
jgi:Tol biopolymer transport system component